MANTAMLPGTLPTIVQLASFATAYSTDCASMPARVASRPARFDERVAVGGERR